MCLLALVYKSLLCAWLLSKFYYFGQASWTLNFHMRMVNLPHEA
jgi:hypothetical protein